MIEIYKKKIIIKKYINEYKAKSESKTKNKEKT